MKGSHSKMTAFRLLTKYLVYTTKLCVTTVRQPKASTPNLRLYRY